jgi:hypothetical protein
MRCASTSTMWRTGFEPSLSQSHALRSILIYRMSQRATKVIIVNLITQRS